jgi:hypothetical protein
MDQAGFDGKRAAIAAWPRQNPPSLTGTDSFVSTRISKEDQLDPHVVADRA